MERQLDSLLRKLAQSEGPLDPAELSYLRTLAGEPPAATEPDGHERRPLWAFIRRGYATTIYASRPRNVYPRDHLETLVRAMTGSIVPGVSVLGLLATPVTRSELIRAVAEQLADADDTRRGLAIRLAGHCRLVECGGAIARRLDEETDTKLRMVCCESLGRMGYPETGEAVAPFLDSQSDDLWYDARAALLLTSGQVTPQFVRDLLERGSTSAGLLVRFRSVLLPAAARANLQPGAFAKALGDGGRGTRVCQAVADMAIATENLAVVEDLLGDTDADMRAAMGLAAAVARASWTAPALRTAVAAESVAVARRCLVAALSWVVPEPEQILRGALASSDLDERVGAVWGALGRPQFNEALARLDDVDADELRIAIGCTLSVNTQGDADDDVRREYYWSRLIAGRWWDHTIPRCLAKAAGVSVPPTFAWFDTLTDPWGDDDLGRAASFVQQHPAAAFAKMSRLTTRLAGRRLIACHGLANTPTSRGYLEHRLLAATDANDLAHLYLELACCGGPQTVPGQLMAKSLATTEAMELREHELSAATVVARAGAVDARLSVIAALPGLGPKVEPHLLALLIDAQPKIADAAASAATRLAEPREAYLRAVQTVLRDRTPPQDRGVIARMVASGSPALRAALAEVLDRQTHRSALWALAADRNVAVAGAARVALGDRPESRALYLLRLDPDAKASASVEARVADHARQGAVLLAPGDYNLGPVYEKTAPHKTNDLPGDIEHGLCDAGRAFISEHRRTFAKIFGAVDGMVNFKVGFTNVTVEQLRAAITELGDDANDADMLVADS